MSNDKYLETRVVVEHGNIVIQTVGDDINEIFTLDEDVSLLLIELCSCEDKGLNGAMRIHMRYSNPYGLKGTDKDLILKALQTKNFYFMKKYFIINAIDDKK